MKKLTLYLFFTILATDILYARHIGHVFIDKNQNGIYDKGDKPMKGISVSDGLHVVQTASDGSFTLPGHQHERFIFITTPSGYKNTQAYYMPVCSTRTVYEFGLSPSRIGIKPDGSHSFIHITDTEIFNTENHEDWTGDIQRYVAGQAIAFIIHTGDLCYEKGLKEHINLMNSHNMGCPVFYAIGNHDLVRGRNGEELFENIYGPTYYSFDVGNIHYIVTPMPNGDYRPGYTQTDVYNWLKNDLKHVSRKKSIIVFNHDLLTYGDQFIYGTDKQQIDLSQYNLKAWIYGHWHNNYVRQQGSVRTISTATLDKGGIDHSTNAFRVIHIGRNGELDTELRYTYLDRHIRLASPTEKQIPVMPSGAVPVTVNTYSSASPTRQVTLTCRIEGKNLLTDEPLQQQTDWSWNTTLPLNKSYEGKDVCLLVKAIFNNGETIQTGTTFTYRFRMPSVHLAGNWDNLLGSPAHIIPPQTDTLKYPLQMAWVQNIGANIYMTSPLIYQNSIYIASTDEDLKGKAAIYALNAHDGSLRWKYNVRNSIKNTIVIEEGRVLAQDVQGTLYAVDAQNGQLCWEKKLPLAGLPSLVEGLVADNGVVYAGTGQGLCAIYVKDGQEVWRNEDWRQGQGTTTTFSLTTNRLIASSQWGALYGNDRQTGKLIWKASDNGLRNRGSSVAVHGNLLYLISDHSFFILDAQDGHVIVRKKMPFSVDVTSTPLLTDGEIIFGTAQNGLIALDKETLDIKWNFQTADALLYTVPYLRKPASTIETSPVLSGNTIYIGASDGTLYGINRTDGKLIWKHAMGAPILNSVALSGNSLVVADFGGNIYLFTSY